MDKTTIIGASAIIILLIIFVCLVSYHAVISEDALQQCTDRGFDYFDDFEISYFTNKALGVKCAYASYTRKDIDAEGQAVIVG